ncbi:MAG: hypothetical protein ACI9NC_000145 [Verrucomicrobiales bacterium]|jgi:hypothetical protein
MSLRRFLPILTAACLFSSNVSNAALLIHYTFDETPVGALGDAATIANSGTSGIDGTASITGGSLTITSQTGGNYLSVMPTGDGLEGIAAAHISTGSSIGSLGIAGDQNYTLMAWVRFNNQTGDNMIFGGNAGDVLHLGARNAQYHSGHWGDDLNSGATSTEAGAWHHVTYTNTAAGLQEIFVDGANVASGNAPGTGAYTSNLSEILLVGSSRNGGSLNGDLDDIRVYDEVLDQAAINAIAGVDLPPARELLIHYTFDSEPAGALSNGATIANAGTSGTDGRAGVPSGSLTISDDANRVNGEGGALGNYLSVQPSSDPDQGVDAAHISTGGSLTELGLSGDLPYSMMAWVRFDNQIGDNIVFGGNSGAVLQLGSRNDDYLSGHSGDDIDSADAPNTETGSWHHVAWTNSPLTDGDSSGAQEIFVDGVSVAGPGATAVVAAIDANLGEILLVGSSVNGGSFSGSLDDVRVYNGLVNAAEIALIIDDATAPPVNSGGLMIHYTFDVETTGVVADGAVIANAGNPLIDGTASSIGGSLTILNDDSRVNGAAGLFGNYLLVEPSADNLEGVAAPHISTGSTIEALQIAGNQDYTMMAWLRFANQSGDNMIFGGNSGDVLHLGARNAQYHSGHWGDDLNSGATSTEAGAWHHVTYTNTTDGLQEIFVDGANVASGNAPGTGAYTNNLSEILLIGSSRNGGSFNGAIDDVRVYDSVLDTDAIEVIINSSTATPQGLQFTHVSHDADNDTVTLSFTSSPNKIYSLFWSSDLQDGPGYLEINDGVEAHATDDVTTITIPIPVPEPNPQGEFPSKVFFILRENAPPP